MCNAAYHNVALVQLSCCHVRFHVTNTDSLAGYWLFAVALTDAVLWLFGNHYRKLSLIVIL